MHDRTLPAQRYRLYRDEPMSVRASLLFIAIASAFLWYCLMVLVEAVFL